jgi:hypothetical protein
MQKPFIKSDDIDKYFRKIRMKVDGKTKIDVALMIELMDGFAVEMIQKYTGANKNNKDCVGCKHNPFALICNSCSRNVRTSDNYTKRQS